jgi:hypothetical protein
VVNSGQNLWLNTYIEVMGVDDVELHFKEKEAAAILGVSPRTLSAGRQGRGAFKCLKYIKMGTRVTYSSSAIQGWIELGTVTPPETGKGV